MQLGANQFNRSTKPRQLGNRRLSGNGATTEITCDYSFHILAVPAVICRYCYDKAELNVSGGMLAQSPSAQLFCDNTVSRK